MSRQLWQEEDEGNPETSGDLLVDLFTAVSAERRLIAYMSNRKRNNYDPSVPKSFSEAYEYLGYFKTIDRE